MGNKQIACERVNEFVKENGNEVVKSSNEISNLIGFESKDVEVSDLCFNRSNKSMKWKNGEELNNCVRCLVWIEDKNEYRLVGPEYTYDGEVISFEKSKNEKPVIIGYWNNGRFEKNEEKEYNGKLFIGIKEENIYDAIKYIDENKVPMIIKDRILIINDKKYSPKTVMAVANFIVNNRKISTDYFHSNTAVSYLEKCGFSVQSHTSEINEEESTSNQKRLTEELSNEILEDIYVFARKVYQDEITVANAAAKLVDKHGEVIRKKNSYEKYITSCSNLIKGKDIGSSADSDIIFFTIKKIFDDYGIDSAMRACNLSLSYADKKSQKSKDKLLELKSKYEFLKYEAKYEFLKDVFMSEDQYESLKNNLLHKQNIILQGAPGVGKTFSATRLAYSIMGEKDKDRIKVVQFHQNYSYEDFVLGYKPCGTSFELKEGVFYEFCKKAEKDHDREYFFIIDEINRGNMSKIFGELLMLIEKDYRGCNNKIDLAYTNESGIGKDFFVPKNLYIIGMMNTADRSLAMIDYALRRRFSFFDVEPGFKTEQFKEYQKKLNNDTFNKVIEVICKLNEKICEDKSLGEGFCIGHSYFCNYNVPEQGEVSTETIIEKRVRNAVTYDILPMLKEYWFDNKSEYDKWRMELNEACENG
ncbi:MAG: AAA family ATPase [Oscillospiraceae bacterium]|nr:AAA family ATPase [Oscillospiraceae bacterium]